MTDQPETPPKSVGLWLINVCVLILLMVAVGGITRLTESGLSMVDWRPLMGTIPPLTEEAWEDTFAQYRAYPEYRILKPGMTLPEFKQIFFWEYIHRVLGRVIGLVFFVPLVWFAWRRVLTRRLLLQLIGVLILGAAQGFMGWFMVQSGLADKPYVSHYRLAAHLGLAFFLFAYLIWILMDIRPRRAPPPAADRGCPPWMLRFVQGFTGLVCLQVLYGAFTAGLDAGYSHNTFPLMLGKWFPPGGWSMTPAWINLLDNPATVQFIHRGLGWLLMAGALFLWAAAFRLPLRPVQRLFLQGLASFIGLQFLLGVITLILHVPVAVATLHQVMACLLVGACAAALYVLKEDILPGQGGAAAGADAPS